MNTRFAVSLIAACLLTGVPAQAEPPQFESPHVHPIARVGDYVLVVNTPDARLSIFDKSGDELALLREVRVGIDPVTVRAKDGNTAWVVNHLSDDISIVDLTLGTVVHTLNVGDEPTDVVFVDDPIEDDGSKWAVLSLSQEDRVIVCDAEFPYSLFGVIDIPGADPRSLALDENGTGVWVSVFESGNNTTFASRALVNDPLNPWGAGNLPPFDPPLNPDLDPALMPTNGVIVRKVGGAWLDEMGGDWSPLITWDLLDIDLVHIDVTSAVPVISTTVTGVGTLIHDVAVNSNGDVWAVNIEAFNEVLFEPKLKGEAVRNRITQVPAGTTTPQAFPLNPHISFGPPGLPNPASSQALKDQSLAIPTEVLIARNGTVREIYVSGIGGERLVVLNPNNGAVKRRLSVPEGGTGLVMLPGGTGVVQPLGQAPGRDRKGTSAEELEIFYRAAIKGGDLLMVNRFLNRVHVIDPFTGDTGEWVPIGKSDWDPTPTDVKNGRRFLYTGSESAHGTFACASCHPSGNMDAIAWDLGNPAGDMVTLNHANPPFTFDYHPLKGPMVTQSLRGLQDHNPLHWRGDKLGFTDFNGAFESLLGGSQLPTQDMLDFEAFTLAVLYPPNPFNDLDNLIQGPFEQGGDPAQGAAQFDTLCERCHVLPTGTGNDVQFLGNVFGNQNFVVPQLRNLYEKEGFVDFTGPNNKRGFGFLHDGMERNLDEFIVIFTLPFQQHFNMKAFLRSFPTGADGALAQEVTLNTQVGDLAFALDRANSLQNAAAAGRVDLIAHGRIDGVERGFLWVSPSAGGLYQSDRLEGTWTFQDLMDAVNGQGASVTLTAVPFGEGPRMGVDRDLDGYLDGDEDDAGSDSADPGSTPGILAVDTPRGNPALTRLTSVFPQPFRSSTRIELYLAAEGRARVEVFDVSGRKVRELMNNDLAAGSHVVPWDGVDDRGLSVGSGAYFVKLSTPDGESTRKVVRLE